ncbi:MAG TPA: MmgE/PrpD family protein [Vicinamibacterales bacterium]|nr:MmgE/PrpD family protein [Vicinamibacterales bacterium]
MTAPLLDKQQKATAAPWITRELADVLASAADHLPAAVLGHAHRAVLDWLGSALAGAREPQARMAQQVALRFGRSDESTLLGAGRGSAPAAAFANGIASHILELDDIHKGSTVHAAAPIIPAAVAVAERERRPGRALLAAVAIGYEAAFRIGEAVNPSHYRYWHPTGTAATFGAAAAAGALLGLTALDMRHALGTAGTQAAGLWEFNADGAMSKHLHPGKAALNGVLSADLAKAGFTSASRILEGERGFFRAMSASCDPSRVTEGLGTDWKIGENGYKLHACCGHTHSAIDLVLALRGARGWSAADVRAQVAAIDVETYDVGFGIVKEMHPRSPYQGKFSMAYCVAAGLLEGRVDVDQFSADRFGPDGVRQPAIATLLGRTRVRVADDLSARYPAAWPARVTVTLVDGSRISETADYPRGNPENPVDTEELRAKFIALVAPRLGRPAADAALAAIDALPECDDVAQLFRPLGNGG